MSRKAFAMLEWRLKEASERFVRCHFSGFMHTVRQVDETGQVLEPRGQAIDLNVLQRAGDVALVHSCIEATGAEIDFLERAAYFYISRNPTVASLKAILITLSIGPTEYSAAITCGLVVCIDGTPPPNALDAKQPTKQFRARPPAPQCARFVPVPSNTNLLKPPPSLTSSPSTPLDSSTNSISSRSSDSPRPVSGNHTPPTTTSSTFCDVAPSADMNYLQLDWEVFLLSSGIEQSAATSFSELVAKCGISVPSDPRRLPWNTMKEIKGVKLGHLRKLQKYVESKYGAIPSECM